jgi:fluoride exporter
MGITSWIAVGGGAAAGAWLRWFLGAVLNPLFPTVPLGTLASNLVAGFLMGIAMELITRNAAMPAEMRLLMTTGFLGGLSTFSTFSGEVVTLLSHREYLWTGIMISAHVVGSVALTIAGIFAARLLMPLEAL